jgi:pentatricopeptide repeat protein
VSWWYQNKYGQAIYYLRKYLSHFGTNLEILNILAECFYQSGEFEEAKAVWKKSLEIAPQQEQIRKKLEAVEKK